MVYGTQITIVNGVDKSIYDYGYGSIPMKIPFLVGYSHPF
jgi:hypothetical protein